MQTIIKTRILFNRSNIDDDDDVDDDDDNENGDDDNNLINSYKLIIMTAAGPR